MAEPGVAWSMVAARSEGLILLSGGPDGPVDLVARGQGMAAPKIGSMVRVTPERVYVFEADGDQQRLS